MSKLFSGEYKQLCTLPEKSPGAFCSVEVARTISIAIIKAALDLDECCGNVRHFAKTGFNDQQLPIMIENNPVYSPTGPNLPMVCVLQRPGQSFKGTPATYIKALANRSVDLSKRHHSYQPLLTSFAIKNLHNKGYGNESKLHEMWKEDARAFQRTHASPPSDPPVCFSLRRRTEFHFPKRDL
ncbi:hypothetical protein FOXB_11446 [Fusarium oxysporum f. sp. conglutinans Fo5176]|uniref:Uncharacterized protein n=1 Tax=Fusarium oxysporum (strain Fo5176) TaxID=660025 RepID=F9FYG4_FUSOF|nr:hypothetical protein FOXB_11446 [Fusarium oxysporum f. sp. conglutinans Fo5176]